MKSKRMVLLVTFCLLYSLLCSVIYAAPTQGAKLKFTSVAYSSRVLNVENNGTPQECDEVTTRPWTNNDTQWWKTSYYATIGGFSTYTLAVYNYPTLYANYHQSNGYCTLHGAANNSYHDYTICWETSNNYDMMYLWYYDKFLHVAGNSDGAHCVWQHVNGATNYERWNVSYP